MTPDEIQQHIGINVIGPNELVKAVEPHLRQGSTVLNMTNGLGSFGVGVIKCAAYSLSKAALNMATVHLAGELKSRGVRVILVDPGWVKTRMGGDDAILKKEESIGGMLKALHEEDIYDTGTFYQWDGKVKPW